MRKLASFVAAVSMAFGMLPALPAAAQDSAGSATVTIDQRNPIDVIGKWTLIMPGSVETKGESASEVLTNLVVGTYTIFAEAPDGANTTIRRYLGTTLIDTVERGQMTFMVQEGEDVRLSIHYTFVRVGTVAVHSDPKGITFSMTGPNNMNVTGVTPMSFDDVPVGQYAVQYEPLNGCTKPPRQAYMLEERSRITFDVTMSCKSADILRERETEPDQQEFVSVMVDGVDVTLRDVPQNTWFTPFVFRAAKLNIVSGYKNERGEPSGEFGPDRPVTIGELAAMTQRAAGLHPEDASGIPENRSAQGTWAAPFVAYAEQNGWTVFADATVDIGRPATRGEVVMTLLQAFDIPLRWAKGGMFTDVTARTVFAAAVETAAGDGLVGGYVDEEGELTGLFGPADGVTRAQAAKILITAIDTYRLDLDEAE